MPTLYENYTTGDNDWQNMDTTQDCCQTFTPSTSHNITSVKLLIYKKGTPNTLYITIKATDGNGKPTGSALASGSIDGNGLGTETSGAWTEITLGAGANLTASTKYAIVGVTDGGAYPTHYVAWRFDSSGEYSGGQLGQSSDDQATWTMAANQDFLFEEYGDPLATTITISGATATWTGGALNTVFTKTISGASVIWSAGQLVFNFIQTVAGATVTWTSGALNFNLLSRLSGGVITWIGGGLKIVKDWQFKTKNSSTWTGKTKNVSTWSSKTKNSSNWTNKTKN